MNYVECIAEAFPDLQVSCYGEPEVYENLQADCGGVLPSKAVLDGLMMNTRRNQVWQKLQAHRDWRESNNGTPVMINGVQKWFHSDDPSKIKQLALVKAADLGRIPPDLDWKTMDRSFVTMTPELAYDIYIQAMLLSTEIFAVAERHRQNIMASNNPEEYDYSEGWPQMFSEWLAIQNQG